jgi:hypothetical protein
MHYFYYLKLKTIYNISLWYTTNFLQFFKIYPTCIGACFAPSSGVSLNQISCLVGLLLGMLCSCCSVVLFVGPYPTVVIHCWCPACVLSRIYPEQWITTDSCVKRSRRPLVCLAIPACDRISGLINRLTILKLGLCITLTGLCRSLGLRTGMQGVFLFIKHINVGGHTLVGRLSGIWTQSGRVTASNSATVYRHFGEAAVSAGECGPCPVFA